jgi:hypothetical protein
MKTKTIRLTEDEFALIMEGIGAAEMHLPKNIARPALWAKLMDTKWDTKAIGLEKLAQNVVDGKYNDLQKAFQMLFKTFYDGMTIGEIKGRSDR